MGVLDTFHRVVRRGVRLSGARTIETTLAGYRIHAYDMPGKGEGPPLVLVHGVAASAHSFLQTYRALRRRWSRVFALDLAGHGFSPLDEDQPAADVVAHDAVLKAFLDEVVRTPAVLAGNSLGGALALKAAIDRPDMAGLLLLAPAGAPLSDEGLEGLRTKFTPRTRGDAVRTLGMMLHRPNPGSWLIAHEFVRTFTSPHVQTVLRSPSVRETIDPAAVRALKMPVTLVWGASERLLPADGLDWFRAHLPPHAHIEVMARAGHLPMLEQPRRVVALLDDLRHAALNARPAF